MLLRKIAPVIGLALAFGSGCQHSAGAASPPEGLVQTPAPFATPPVLPGTPDVATLVSKVRPAVVNITTEHEMKAQRGMFGPSDLGEMFPFFHQGRPGMPRNRGGGEGGDEVMKQQALGSRFLIDAQGHVVTNAHVVDDAQTV